MVRSDLDGVVTIETASFPVPWSVASFREELRNPIARSLVAVVGDAVRGYACAWVVAGEIKINNVAVDPRCLRGGIGGKLLERLLADARAEGCREATLEVRPSNTAARRLYTRAGFREVGTRPGYYQDNGEDAVLMSLPL